MSGSSYAVGRRAELVASVLSGLRAASCFDDVPDAVIADFDELINRCGNGPLADQLGSWRFDFKLTGRRPVDLLDFLGTVAASPQAAAADGRACETVSALPAVSPLPPVVEVPGMSWQEAAERMERIRGQGEQYSSQPNLPRKLVALQRRLTRRSGKRLPFRSGQKPRRTRPPEQQSLGAGVLDNTAQQRELDPASVVPIDEIELMQRKLIEQAPADKRAEVNEAFSTMSREEKQKTLSVYLQSPM